jgi:hypothetical protein
MRFKSTLRRGLELNPSLRDLGVLQPVTRNDRNVAQDPLGHELLRGWTKARRDELKPCSLRQEMGQLRRVGVKPNVPPAPDRGVGSTCEVLHAIGRKCWIFERLSIHQLPARASCPEGHARSRAALASRKFGIPR